MDSPPTIHGPSISGSGTTPTTSVLVVRIRQDVQRGVIALRPLKDIFVISCACVELVISTVLAGRDHRYRPRDASDGEIRDRSADRWIPEGRRLYVENVEFIPVRLSLARKNNIRNFLLKLWNNNSFSENQKLLWIVVTYLFFYVLFVIKMNRKPMKMMRYITFFFLITYLIGLDEIS